MSNGIDAPKHFSVTQNGNDMYLLNERYKYPLMRQTIMESPAEVRAGGENVFYGRGTHLVLPVSDLKDRRLVIRHYRHGGLWGRLVGDVLWGHGRPLKELVVAEGALERDIDTAEVVALRFRRLFGPLCRADIFTLEISGADDLIAFLCKLPASEILSQKKELIKCVVRAVKRLHDSGILHADLHLKNILLKKNEINKVYIIDLDKSELCPNATGAGLLIDQRMGNILRLDRSVEKFMAWRPDLRLITRADRLRFLKLYLEEPGSREVRNWKAVARRYATHHRAHRFWWKLLKRAGLGIYDFERHQTQQ